MLLVEWPCLDQTKQSIGEASSKMITSVPATTHFLILNWMAHSKFMWHMKMGPNNKEIHSNRRRLHGIDSAESKSHCKMTYV